MTRIYLSILIGFFASFVFSQTDVASDTEQNNTEHTTSYYTYKNNDRSGPIASQTLANLDFFAMMYRKYGFKLTNYVIYVGNKLDDEFNNASQSERLKLLFPKSYKSIQTRANELQINIDFLDDLDKIKQLEYADTQKNKDGLPVCIGSCLRDWDDAMVISLFGDNSRSHFEFYGNPWLLSDRNIPRFARIYKIYTEYKNILVSAKKIKTKKPLKISNIGSGRGRLITITNNSGSVQTITLNLNSDIGLKEKNLLELRSFHPRERIVSYYPFEQIIELEILPFQTTLHYVGPKISEEPKVSGIDYIQEENNDEVIVYRLLAPRYRGRKAYIKLKEKYAGYDVDGKEIRRGAMRKLNLVLKDRPNVDPYWEDIGAFTRKPKLENKRNWFEVGAFGINDNPLYTRNYKEFGSSDNVIVNKAQIQFYQNMPKNVGPAWDRHLFDNNVETAYAIREKSDSEDQILRIDLGKIYSVDSIKILVANKSDLAPQKVSKEYEIEVSTDFKNWSTLNYAAQLESKLDVYTAFRYLRMPQSPNRISEFKFYSDGLLVESEDCKATTYAPYPGDENIKQVWSRRTYVGKVHLRSCVQVNIEGIQSSKDATVLLDVDDEIYVLNLQSIVYPKGELSELPIFSYSIPITEEMTKNYFEVIVLSTDENMKEPSGLIVSENPFDEKILTIRKVSEK